MRPGPSLANRDAPAWRARTRACQGQAGAARFVDGQIGRECGEVPRHWAGNRSNQQESVSCAFRMSPRPRFRINLSIPTVLLCTCTVHAACMPCASRKLRLTRAELPPLPRCYVDRQEGARKLTESRSYLSVNRPPPDLPSLRRKKGGWTSQPPSCGQGGSKPDARFAAELRPLAALGNGVVADPREQDVERGHHRPEARAVVVGVELRQRIARRGPAGRTSARGSPRSSP